MLKKLRIKFVCINMTIITIMLVFILCMVVNFTKAGMEQSSIQMMNQLASNPLYLIKPTDDMDIRLPHFSLRLNRTGDLIETYNRYYDLSDDDYLDEIILLSSEYSGQTGVIEEHNLRFMRVSTPNDQFLIFVDISNEITTINNLTRTCIIIGIFSFIAFLGISIFLANWAVKPVEKAWTQQKQFIADASHELKTPLTVILTNSELLQDSIYNNEQKVQFSKNILTVSRQMKNLVEKLLELSRIDNSSLKTIMKDFDFSELVETSLCLFEPLFYEAGLELTSELTSDVHLKGSAEHLSEVVDILLDNALKYAFHGSQIHVTLKKEHSHCLLSVASHGNAISEEDLKNIFKRFYRTDKSRSSSASYGLGLSIAESIITEHRGKIWAESIHNLNTFFIQLPLK